jgi:hypothetical protein
MEPEEGHRNRRANRFAGETVEPGRPGPPLPTAAGRILTPLPHLDAPGLD